MKMVNQELSRGGKRMEGRFGSGLRMLLAMLLCAVLLFQGLPGQTAQAAVDCSIEVSFSKIPVTVSGTKIALYKIGTVEGTTFSVDPYFVAQGGDFLHLDEEKGETVEGAMENIEKAPLLEDFFVTEGELANDEESIHFTGLVPGVYFGKKSGGPSEFGMDPFFVTLLTQVVVHPKWQLVTEAEVKKRWEDEDNQDGKRPTSIEAALYVKDKGSEKDPVPYKDITVTLSEDNDWTAKVDKLPKVVGEAEQEYSFQETVVPDFYTHDPETDAVTKAPADGNNTWITTITNTHEVERTEVSILKVWDDEDNKEGFRPEKITVRLEPTGEEYELSEANEWTVTVPDLPVYENGKEIVYTWTETLPDVDPSTEDDSYSLISTECDDEYGHGLTTLTNQHTPGETSATVTKVWDDANNADGKRPASIEVQLLKTKNGVTTDALSAPIVLNEENKWTHTEEHLAKYEDGVALTYSWSEVEVPEGYTQTTEVGVDQTVITNTLIPKTEVTVVKIWEDENDQDGIRPDQISVRLSPINRVYALNEANGWSVTVQELDKYDADGNLINYVWTEVQPERIRGYVSGKPTTMDGSTVTSITNTHTPEVTDITVTKVWEDANNQDGKRPDSVTVQLKADGRAYGEPKTLNQGNSWKETWTDLPVYRDKGTEIRYTIDEVKVNGYSVKVDPDGENKYAFTITNSYTPEETNYTVHKFWNDANDQDGIRPASVTVQLYADGAPYGEPVALNAGNNWEYTWNKLPLKAEGKEIVYTVDETEVPEGYTKTVDGADITNTHEPETKDIPVEKIWNDADDQDGKRPNSITVTLLADGVARYTAELNAGNNWHYTWPDLPVYRAKGIEIKYEVSEEQVRDYGEPEITGDAETGFIVTNPHTPEETEIDVTKEWDDKDNQDGVRPRSITVQLLADNVKVEGKEATLTEENNWSYAWSNLPKYADGREIRYTVQEIAVESYQAEISGTAARGYTIKNTHTPGKTQITVVKVWNDANNQDGIRPASVNVQLYANGEKYGNAEALNEGNQWTYTWYDLDANAAGQPIEYTVEETEAPAGYTVAVTGTAAEGYTVTNTHETEETVISVTKVWVDGEDQDKLRPSSIQARLLGNGEVVDVVELNAENGWAHSWENLPKNSEGKPVVYTVEEVVVPEGYTATVTGSDQIGFIITNQHTPSVGSLIIRKRVTVNNATPAVNQLPMVQGVYTFRLTDEKGLPVQREEGGQLKDWEVTITNEPTNEVRINNLKPGRYAIAEIDMPADMTLISPTDYAIVVVVGNNEADVPVAEFVNNRNVVPTPTPTTPVINTPTPPVGGPTPTPVPMIHIDGQKIWDDESNLHNVRPANISVSLYANGTLVSSQPTWTNTDSDTWSYDFGDFPAVDAAGMTIEYNVREEPLADYTATIAGFTITNRLIPRTTREYTTFSGVKIWLDNNNADRGRPYLITIQLLRDGVLYEERTVTAASNWAYSFENVPVDDGYGNTYTYTLNEVPVRGYYTRTDGLNFINGYIPPQETELLVDDDLYDLFDYETPLFGMQTTGDDIPVYPFIFGGVGMAAVLALVILSKKNKRSEVRK